MEGRDTASPKATHTYPQHGHDSHGPFSAYFRDPGYSLMGSSASIIHTPLAKRHSSSSPPFSVLSGPDPNPSPSPNASTNINSNLSANANSVAPNPNLNAIPVPNSANAVYFGGSEIAEPSPGSALVVSLADRSSSEPVKKKRGRPRKYIKDENGVLVSISSSPQSGPSLSKPKKKKPPSGKKAQLLALGPAGQDFRPHVLQINAGEDVSTKIITFTSQGPWAVCILSANGTISNATLRLSGVSGGAVTYEGRFEILSLSGSFLLSENAGTRSRTGGLSVSLAGPDGRVIGGGVAGLLMAASPVQVVVGTFYTDIRKPSASGEDAKSSGFTPAEAPAPVPMIQPGHMDADDSRQDHIPSGFTPVRAPPPAPMIQPERMEVDDSRQDHILRGPSGDGDVQPRAFQIDSFRSHFGGDTDPDSGSPGGP